ncbi:hypothetical protein, partial [Enterobacter kobei]|uniref:hypothetical protein n=1 Tax=Enterobacter kobei TaxID=208224 RepID=UPI003CF50A00
MDTKRLSENIRKWFVILTALWSVVIAPVFPAYASFLLPDLGAPAAHSAKGKSAADRDDAQ